MLFDAETFEEEIDEDQVFEIVDRAIADTQAFSMWKEIGLNPYRNYSIEEITRIQKAIESLDL